SRAKRRVLACGTRWGKSTCAAAECIAALLEPREATHVWLVAPTYELTRRIFDRVLRAVQTAFSYQIREVNTRVHSLKLTNMGGGISELRARSADRPEGLLGDAVDALVVDEAASVKESVWDEFLAPRLIDRNGWALMVSTPHARGWFHRQWRL